MYDFSKVYKVEAPIKIAERVKQSIEHKAGKSATYTIPFKGPFVQVHFSDFSLPDGDSITLSTSAKHRQKIKAGDLNESGLSNRLDTGSSTLTIEYKSNGRHHSRDAKGFAIDYILHEPKKAAKKEDVCGAKPAWEPAQCLAKTDSVKYTLSKATARMVIQGGQGAGTGFLIGCDGWFLTNEHNIETQAATTAATYEFGSECSCDDKQGNTKMMGCEGKVKITGDATLFAVNKELDYTLVQFDKKHWATLEPFGYFTLRRSGAELGEKMWAPQYPQAHPLQIVQRLENQTATTITSLNVENECGKGQVGYYADTMGGSSGAPVVGNADNQVIALHHCGGCQNVAYSTKKILDDVEKIFKSKNIPVPTCWTQAKGGLGKSAAETPAKKHGNGKQPIDLSSLFTPKGDAGGKGTAPSVSAGGQADTKKPKKHHKTALSAPAGAEEIATQASPRHHTASGEQADAKKPKKHHKATQATPADIEEPAPHAPSRHPAESARRTKKSGRRNGGARNVPVQQVEQVEQVEQVVPEKPRRRRQSPRRPVSQPVDEGEVPSRRRRGGRAPPTQELYEVKVCKAATYAVDAPPCSETGDACPKAYDVPIGGCYPGVINSPTGCVVPEDAICMQAPSPQDGSIYYKCVFPSVGC
ncbi:hypothetical protein DYB32_009346 [Aphanomyces invadans]|uniref:Serine protease n=1 Tax=Aphanomyces invadans TaxID=157072 RepID=A0A3R6YSK7_9STRA|nr:hypothetical protein DYB32_009346 [Aphanomyces invadans]